ncbi:MAG: IS110 family transposase [Actinobacteria bacterium HGW-Actinobacteria-7]|jgi:transposase|nr:MAG: IS110 family transposase [Actinobacteria bacterium HGW-Actinobacteria-7]
MAGSTVVVIGGVDTHGHTHQAAAIDSAGRLLGGAEFEACAEGYRDLLAWLRDHGTIESVGVEGTGSYGAGLCRHLVARGVDVVEVDRPDRKTRRAKGKSDPIDAECAARAVLAGTATTTPKDRRGVVESIRMLRIARSGAVKARTAAINALKTTMITAPEGVRAAFDLLTAAKLIDTCRALRPDRTHLEDPVQGAKLALRTIARRIEAFDLEIRELDSTLTRLVGGVAPATLALAGIGVDHAGQLLVSAGQNPERLHSEAAFARLCGAAPIPASSGRTSRHRLSRGGDRQANRALHMAVVVRLRRCPRTRAYAERRTAEGLSKPEIMRCLKRYLAREVYHALQADLRALEGVDSI